MNKTIINPVIKDEITFTQTALETEGRITTLLVRLMPGGGTPLHYHRNFAETFSVFEGVLTVTMNNQPITLTAGQTCTVQKEVPHRFSNDSTTPVVFTTVIIPGSAGFEQALRILYGLAADNGTNRKGVPKSLVALAVISRMSEMRPAGWGKLLAPLMGLLHVVARIRGTDKKLLNKYCKAE